MFLGSRTLRIERIDFWLYHKHLIKLGANTFLNAKFKEVTNPTWSCSFKGTISKNISRRGGHETCSLRFGSWKPYVRNVVH